MAVIKCPECGSEISSESARCPNCGVPAEVWAEEISSSYSPPVASKNNSEEKHIVECCEESKGKGRFNKIIAAIVIVLLVALLGVAALKLTSNHLIGRSKSEAEYRSAVYAHITDSHGEAIDSYDSFVLSDPYLKPQPLPPDHIRRNCYFNEDGHLCVKNLSAFWIPELTVTEVIHGTVYTVTGSYEGDVSFLKKLERITAKKFTEKTEDSE